MSIEPDYILSEDLRVKFLELLQTCDRIIDPDMIGYNGAADPSLASVNICPVQRPNEKAACPTAPRTNIVELQAQFDELEQTQVFRRPENLDITAEYLNPSFLVKKPSGGHRLVTAFADVARYSKPQPSLMPDVDTTLSSMALHDKNRSHPCLPPDPLLQVFFEVLRRSHTLSWNSRLRQISYENAWVRDCA